LPAALQIAPADNGAAEAAPAVTNITAAIASDNVVIVRMTSPNFCYENRQ